MKNCLDWRGLLKPNIKQKSDCKDSCIFNLQLTKVEETFRECFQPPRSICVVCSHLLASPVYADALALDNNKLVRNWRNWCWRTSVPTNGGSDMHVILILFLHDRNSTRFSYSQVLQKRCVEQLNEYLHQISWMPLGISYKAMCGLSRKRHSRAGRYYRQVSLWNAYAGLFWMPILLFLWLW